MRKKIEEFIDSLDNIPKFAHNHHSDRIYYGGPDFGKEELVEAIDTLLNGKWAVAGEKVAEFERETAKYLNQSHAIMVNSGSSANLIAITAAKKRFNWQDGDQIILSVVGFPTTLNPIIQNNLQPVFADIEFDTLNFDLDEVESKISNRTRAIFVSPVLGSPPDIDRLIEISRKHNILLLLDCCDSLGSKWDNKHLSEYFILSTLSFYPAHHISTMQGGMVLSNDEELIRIARNLATWGRSCFTSGTKVKCLNSSKNIEDIKVGEYVFTHKGRYKKVLSTFTRNYSGQAFKIKANNSLEFIVTKGHELLTLVDNNIEWKSSEHLKIGDLLSKALVSGTSPVYLCANDFWSCPIASIESLELVNESVFNIEVDEDSSYHANGIVAHNCHCSGVENLLQNGICGKRFSKWIDCLDFEIDHKYYFTEIGYNLAPLDLQGAIGLVQLKRVDEIHSLRQRNKEEISTIFKPLVKTFEALPKADVSWFGVPLMAESAVKRKLVAHLEKNWIQTRNYFAGNILMHPAYSYLDDYKRYPNACQVLEKVFFVGCSQMIGVDKIEKIRNVVGGFNENLST